MLAVVRPDDRNDLIGAEPDQTKTKVGRIRRTDRDGRLKIGFKDGNSFRHADRRREGGRAERRGRLFETLPELIGKAGNGHGVARFRFEPDGQRVGCADDVVLRFDARREVKRGGEGQGVSQVTEAHGGCKGERDAAFRVERFRLFLPRGVWLTDFDEAEPVVRREADERRIGHAEPSGCGWKTGEEEQLVGRALLQGAGGAHDQRAVASALDLDFGGAGIFDGPEPHVRAGVVRPDRLIEPEQERLAGVDETGVRGGVRVDEHRAWGLERPGEGFFQPVAVQRREAGGDANAKGCGGGKRLVGMKDEGLSAFPS